MAQTPGKNAGKWAKSARHNENNSPTYKNPPRTKTTQKPGGNGMKKLSKYEAAEKLGLPQDKEEFARLASIHEEQEKRFLRTFSSHRPRFKPRGRAGKGKWKRSIIDFSWAVWCNIYNIGNILTNEPINQCNDQNVLDLPFL